MAFRGRLPPADLADRVRAHVRGFSWCAPRAARLASTSAEGGLRAEGAKRQTTGRSVAHLPWPRNGGPDLVPDDDGLGDIGRRGPVHLVLPSLHPRQSTAQRVAAEG